MLSRITDRLEEGIISFLLVGMTLLVFIEVVMRFGFNTGFLWIQELTLLMSAWMVLFGASYGVKVGAHIGVDAVIKLVSPQKRRRLSMIAVILCLVYCALILYGGWIYLAKVYSIGIELDDMPVQKWAAHSILFIGFLLLSVRFLQLFWNIYTGKASGFNLADEAAEVLKDAELLKSAEGPAPGGGET